MLEISYKQIIRVALPLMFTGFIQAIINMTDASFLGHYSKEAFDAQGSAGLWYITFGMLLIGLNDGAQIRMSKAVGESNKQKFAQIFQGNVVVLVSLACLLFIFFYFFSKPILELLSNDKNYVQNEYQFLRTRSIGFFAGAITLCIQSMYIAQGKTKFVLFASLIVAISNVFFSYALIFGEYGFPEWGISGAGFGNSLAEFTGMLFLIGSLLFKKKHVYPILDHVALKGKVAWRSFLVGFPLALQGLTALGVWAIFFSWIEQSQEPNLTVSLNIRHIYFLAFVPIWGFAATTKTYIGQYVGAKQLNKIPVIQRKIQLICILSLFITFHGAFLYPEILISLVNDKQEFIPKSAEILRFISGSLLIYGIFSIYFQTISGIGNTQVTLYIELISTFFYIIGAYLFIKVWHFDLTWVWSVEYIYFCFMGISAYLYLKYVPWQRKLNLTNQ